MGTLLDAPEFPDYDPFPSLSAIAGELLLDAVAVGILPLLVAALLHEFLHDAQPHTHSEAPEIHHVVVTPGPPPPDTMPPFFGGNALQTANQSIIRRQWSPYYHGMVSSTPTPPHYLSQS